EQAGAGGELAVKENAAKEGAGEVIYEAMVAETAAAQLGVDTLVALLHGAVKDGVERAAAGSTPQTERAQLVAEGEQRVGEGGAEQGDAGERVAQVVPAVPPDEGGARQEGARLEGGEVEMTLDGGIGGEEHLEPA